MTHRVIIRKAAKNEPTELVVFGDHGEIVCIDITKRELRLAVDLIDSYRLDHVDDK